MYDILTGKKDSSYLLSLVNINVPCYSLRNYSFLRPEYHRTTYGSYEPVTNMILLFNDCFGGFDFNVTRDGFKRYLKFIKV